MQRHLEAGHKKLPLVIPVLFYTEKRSPYPYSTRCMDEFDDPALAGKTSDAEAFVRELAQHVPQYGDASRPSHNSLNKRASRSYPENYTNHARERYRL